MRLNKKQSLFESFQDYLSSSKTLQGENVDKFLKKYNSIYGDLPIIKGDKLYVDNIRLRGSGLPKGIVATLQNGIMEVYNEEWGFKYNGSSVSDVDDMSQYWFSNDYETNDEFRKKIDSAAKSLYKDMKSLVSENTNINESYHDSDDYRINNDDDIIVIRKNGEVIDKGMVDYLKDNWNDFDDFKFDEKDNKYHWKEYTVEKIIVESNLNESLGYKLHDEVYWVGAGNEIGSVGEIIDLPDEERMTIKWDDGKTNTYSINHPNIQKADEYDNSFNECSKLKESYAIVLYYDENGYEKEKIINGSSPKNVESKVKRIADKYEVKEIHQASHDLKDNEYLNSLGDGVRRLDYNNDTFEESSLNEDIQGGHTIRINGNEKTIYKDYYVVLSNSKGDDFTAEEFDTQEEAEDWAIRQATYNGFGAFVRETESDRSLGYYDPGDMGSDDYEEDEESFTMYDRNNDKEVKVWKQDGKWYDDEGNRYMGYLSKQDVKSYFKGNWTELKEAYEHFTVGYYNDMPEDKRPRKYCVYEKGDETSDVASVEFSTPEEREDYIRDMKRHGWKDSNFQYYDVYDKSNKLKEATDNKEWEEVCKAFCKKIGAELIFVNNDNFGYMDKDGAMVHMYADELEQYLKGKLNEAIEQKYRKSNDKYNSFLRDVKRYTGSYDYQFGGKVDTECYGQPIRVDYFYYLRPYSGFGYNVVVNVLTPMDALWGDNVQKAIEDSFEKESRTKLTNKEIKDKIIQVVSQLDSNK